jgi:hypothetical protein
MQFDWDDGVHHAARRGGCMADGDGAATSTLIDSDGGAADLRFLIAAECATTMARPD